MSKLLYRLGKTAYDKPWYFIMGWILVLGIVGTALGINGVHVSSDIKLEGTASQNVLDKLEKELPQASGGQGSVIFNIPEGERLDTPENLAAISKAVSEVYKLDYVINPAELAAASGADASAMQQQASQSAAGAGGQSADPSNPPPYGPLMIEGMPVPGVLISNAGDVALFQFQFTVQQNSCLKVSRIRL